MAKLLPYFRWYPADAESDNKYAAMTLAELGLYHRCLNHSWLNDGLHVDVSEMSRELRIPMAQLKDLWPRVSVCFEGVDRLRNKRQEEERTHAKTKSVRATDAVRTRYERTASVGTDVLQRECAVVTPRAYGSESVSESLSKKGNVAVLVASGILNFEERFSAAWNRHKKHRGGVTRQMVAQRLLDVDWEAWDAAHVPFCEFWDRAGWQTCAVTMLEWWENGMPLPPPEVANGKKPVSRISTAMEEFMREEL